jgi:hypothetical protein
MILSFMPSGEQRIWRSTTRMKLSLTRDRVRLQNQIACLLEEMRIKLSIVVSMRGLDLSSKATNLMLKPRRNVPESLYKHSEGSATISQSPKHI